MIIKELVNKLEIDRLAPIHWITNLEKKELAKCQYISEKELVDYINNCWDKTNIYENEELGIYLYDGDIEDYFQFQLRYNKYHLDKVMDEIRYLFDVKFYDMDIIFATYVILHELGHWINFKNSRKTSLEYALWDNEFRKKVAPLSEQVRNIPDDDIRKEQFALNALNKYRNIPSEKEADEYAYKNLKKYLDKLDEKYTKPLIFREIL